MISVLTFCISVPINVLRFCNPSPKNNSEPKYMAEIEKSVELPTKCQYHRLRAQDKIRLNADASLRCYLSLISFKSLNQTIEDCSILQPTPSRLRWRGFYYRIVSAGHSQSFTSCLLYCIVVTPK